MAEKLVVLEEFVITTHLRFQSPYGDLESGDTISNPDIVTGQVFQSPYGDLESGD